MIEFQALDWYEDDAGELYTIRVFGRTLWTENPCVYLFHLNPIF